MGKRKRTLYSVLVLVIGGSTKRKRPLTDLNVGVIYFIYVSMY